MKIEDYGTFVRSEEVIDELCFDPKVESYGSFEEVPLKAINKRSKKAQKENLKIENKIAKSEKRSRRRIERVRTVGGFHSISTKLVGIISAIVIISLGTITVLVSHFISADTQVNAEDNNLTINKRTTDDVESRISSIVNSAGLFYGLQIGEDPKSLTAKKNTSLFFERNKDIAAIAFVNSGRFFVNKAFFSARDLEASVFEDYLGGSAAYIEAARNGETKIDNPSAIFETPVMTVYTPIFNGSSNDVCAVLYNSGDLSETFATGSINSSFLVNDEGIILVHPDLALIMDAQDFSNHKMVADMLGSAAVNKQTRYNDEEGEEYFGAYRKIAGTGCGVITEVKSSVIFQAVKDTTRRNVYLSIGILALAVLIIRFFSRSISAPLELLTEVTDQISQANFDTPLFDELDTGRRDEIGVLNRSTRDEQQILNTVTSLTNRGVTQAIVKKTIDFEPHLKDITIFFSDIRGFTAISDGFNKRFGEKSAAEIISFLNDYMSRMVNCIKATGGNVDKFEGDAIMACWGVLRDDDLSFEQLPDSDPKKAFLKAEHDEHVVHDVISSIRSTIGMRYALMKYNKDAEAFTKEHADEPLAKYKPYIKIGCGLNSGRATVGFMGSRDKMEFTSIGDAVNLASRTESSNKPCGTDILITQDTYDLLKKKYVRCEENNFTIDPENAMDEIIVEQIPVTFEVKGKGKQHFYGVVNMPMFDIENFFRRTEPDFEIDDDCKKACGSEGPKTLNEVRALLDIPIPNFGEVNLDAEENKVKVS